MWVTRKIFNGFNLTSYRSGVGYGTINDGGISHMSGFARKVNTVVTNMSPVGTFDRYILVCDPDSIGWDEGLIEKCLDLFDDFRTIWSSKPTPKIHNLCLGLHHGTFQFI